MVFYDQKQFPPAYRNGLFIAFHGSWDRAPYTQGGYNIVFQALTRSGGSPAVARSSPTVLPAVLSLRKAPFTAHPESLWDPTVRYTSPTT